MIDEKFCLKVADFGLASLLWENDNKLLKSYGSSQYWAPEVHLNEGLNNTVDIFSAAIILFIIYTGAPPFQKADSQDSYYKLFCTNRVDKFWTAHQRAKNNNNFFEPEFMDLISLMFTYDFKKRITLDKVFE